MIGIRVGKCSNTVEGKRKRLEVVRGLGNVEKTTRKGKKINSIYFIRRVAKHDSFI